MKLKKLLSGVLGTCLIILSVAGCSNGEDSPQPTPTDIPMGRYIEDEWVLPEGVNHCNYIAMMPDGKIGAMTYSYNEETEENRQAFYTTTDGVNWEETQYPWLDELEEQGRSLDMIHFNSQGYAAIVHSGMEPGEDDSMPGEAFFSDDGDGESETPVEENAPAEPDPAPEGEGEEWEEDAYYGEYTNRVSLMTPDGELIPTEIGRIPHEKATNDFRVFTTSENGDEEVPPDLDEEDEPAVKEDDAVPGDAPSEDGTDGEEAEGEDEENDYDPYVDYFYPRHIQMGEDGLIYIYTYGFIAAYDPDTGEIVQEYEEQGGGFTLVGDGKLAQISYRWYNDSDTNNIQIFNIATGSQEKALNLDMMKNTYSEALWGDDAGNLYLSISDGVYRINIQGETWEHMVNGALTSLSLPSINIQQLLVYGDEEYVVLTDDGRIPRIFHYEYSADTPSRPDTELTIYTLMESQTLQQAIGAFRKANPDVLVTTEVLLDEDSAATADDAIRALNTELLAGKGPDLLLLDGLPLESYQEKGVLADISGLVNEMIDSGEILPNIAKSFEQNGNIYAVPARFTVPSIWGEKEVIGGMDSLSALVDYALANPDKRMFYSMLPRWLLYPLGTACYNEWFQPDGQIDVDSLAAFLEDLTRLSAADGGVPMLWDGDIEAEEDFGDYYKNDQSFYTAVAFAYDRAHMMTYQLNGFQSILEPNGVIYASRGFDVFSDDNGDVTSVPDEEASDIFRLMPNNSGDKVFLPSTIMGINDAGKQKDLATEFLRVMLSEEALSADLYDGFPVNTKAIEYNVTKDERVWYGYGGESQDGTQPFDITMGWPSVAVRRAVTESFAELDTPVVLDSTLMEMIADESAAYFNGSITARDAAEAVSQKMRLALAE